MTFGRTTGMPSRSAWNCISRSLTEAPPSTRSSATGAPPAATTSLLIASSSAALWKAIDSSAARAMWAIVEPRVRPTMVPRASGFQCGAPRPVKAGTNITPPLSGTLSASCLHLAARLDRRRPSRSHCTTAPPMKTLPSRANCGRGAGLRRAGGDQAVGRDLEARAGVHQHEAAGAVGVLHLARAEARLAEQRALLVAGDAADRDRRAEQVGASVVAERRGSTDAPRAAPRAARRAPAAARRSTRRAARRRAACATRCWRRWRGPRRARRRRRAAGEQPHQPGVDGAEGELAAPRRSARAGDVVEQPGELGAGEVGVEDEPGALANERLEAARLQRLARRRRAPVLPDDRVADRLAGARGSRRSSSRAGW